MLTEGIDYHIVGIHFAVSRIACNVWSADKHPLQEFLVQLRFMLPDIEDGIANQSLLQCTEQCVAIHHLATAGIDKIRCTRQATEKRLVSQMEGGIRAFKG